ncbi:conserved exported protein of unknown function [Nitrospira japonica]|uniref:DUF7948 domain-containing protein n=1 Tax=Nitrospira japonica TaxID=1325564 RepID=A0A1W1I505_9BACT|nr:SBBP repeat-containing protein [Nitrospira japonica]SLM48094.1 conserved exported protein of unknown function [Nitrospira japonica]
MQRNRRGAAILRGILLAIALSFTLSNEIAAAPKITDGPASSMVEVKSAYGRLPLNFEANQGQTDSQVKYLARGPGYTVFLTPDETVLTLRPSSPSFSHHRNATGLETARLDESTVLRLTLAGRNAPTPFNGADELTGQVNYLLGNNPEMWRTSIRMYEKVVQPQVYPGIDIVYYGNQQQLEFDFVVAPGADPRAIKLVVGGSDRLKIGVHGDLRLHAGKALQLQRPRAFQDKNGAREEISAHYILTDNQEVSFEVGAYDRSRPLIIDPTLVYATYIGGSNADYGYSIAIDVSGNAYITGEVQSTNFPTTAGVVQPAYGGATTDAFVVKLNSTATARVFSTFLGGTSDDVGNSLAVDVAGNIYVTGVTSSANFPITPGVFQASSGGGPDAFVAKLGSSGTTLIYSTYLGGNDLEAGLGIAVDEAGNAYVAGTTGSGNFPTTLGALQTTWGGTNDGFVTALNATGTSLLYSTYLGGNSYDFARGIALDTPGNAYVTGNTASSNFPTTLGAVQTTFGGPGGTFAGGDAFIAKVDPTGSSLIYSTFLGGSGNDLGYKIALDGSNNAYVIGQTSSGGNFPVTAGAYQTSYGGGLADAFVAAIDVTGMSLIYATYLGGNSFDLGYGIAVDGSSNAYVTGETSSSNFPTTPGAIQETSGGSNAYVTKVDPTGTTVVYSTFLGGSSSSGGQGITVDSSGNAYVTGYASSNFPTTPGVVQPTFAGNVDGFIAKISDANSPTSNFYLHGSGGNNNPIALFLNGANPSATTPKYRDSVGINFNKGNPWKEIGTWTASPSLSSGTLTAPSNLNIWVGLKNSDDQGTQFDVQAEVYKNSSLVAAGETRCVTGVTRNDNLAKQVAVAITTLLGGSFNGTSDVLSLKISTRIGTNADSTKCSGPGGSHNNATGLRVYFDSTSRPAALVGTFVP